MAARSRKGNEAEFTSKALDYMPRWAWASCSILLALSISIRQIGLDVTTPFNRIMTAYAIKIENLQQCHPDANLNDILPRIEALERYSHKPNGSK